MNSKDKSRLRIMEEMGEDVALLILDNGEDAYYSFPNENLSALDVLICEMAKTKDSSDKSTLYMRKKEFYDFNRLQAAGIRRVITNGLNPETVVAAGKRFDLILISEQDDND